MTTTTGLKKGSAEVLILALLEHRPRHGYEVGKVIETRKRRRHLLLPRFSLPEAVSAGPTGLIRGAVGGEERTAAAPVGSIRRLHVAQDDARHDPRGSGVKPSRPAGNVAIPGGS
jgi:hypothetical protein